MWYMIEQKDLELPVLLTMYQVSIAWASKRASRFRLWIEPDMYDRTDDLHRLASLGHQEGEAGQSGSKELRISGVPNPVFQSELTRNTAPEKAVSGDICPVERVEITQSDRVLFGCYDYGRDMTFDLNSEELQELRGVLGSAGVDPERVVVAPRAKAQ